LAASFQHVTPLIVHAEQHAIIRPLHGEDTATRREVDRFEPRCRRIEMHQAGLGRRLRVGDQELNTTREGVHEIPTERPLAERWNLVPFRRIVGHRDVKQVHPIVGPQRPHTTPRCDQGWPWVLGAGPRRANLHPLRLDIDHNQGVVTQQPDVRAAGDHLDLTDRRGVHEDRAPGFRHGIDHHDPRARRDPKVILDRGNRPQVGRAHRGDLEVHLRLNGGGCIPRTAGRDAEQHE